MPTVPGPALVVIETKFVLGGLEAVLDRPAMALDRDQRLDGRSCRTPSGEEGEIAIGDVAADQQAAGPQATIFGIELLGREIGEFKIGPVVKPRSFGSRPRR